MVRMDRDMGQGFGESNFSLCGRDSLHGRNDHINRIKDNAQDEKRQRTLRGKGRMHATFHLNGNTTRLSSTLFFFLRSKEDTGTRDDSPFHRFNAGLSGSLLSSAEQATIDAKSIEPPFRLFSSIHMQGWGQHKLAGSESWN